MTMEIGTEAAQFPEKEYINAVKKVQTILNLFEKVKKSLPYPLMDAKLNSRKHLQKPIFHFY